MKKSIVITGAQGLIGSILTKGLPTYTIIPLDRNNGDLTKLNSFLPLIPNNTDVIIHLAWDPKPIYENGVFNNDNFEMTHNVFEAAVQKKVKRVILASSVHANEYRTSQISSSRAKRGDLKGLEIAASPSPYMVRDPRNDKFLNQDDKKTDWPTSIYGATKLYFEALGRYYATYHGLEVVVIRLGGVNSEDSPDAKDEEDYEKIFLSHADLVTFVKKAIEKKQLQNNYWSFYAVSKQ